MSRGIWASVSPKDKGRIPSVRNKHATTVHSQYLYLFGGRNGNLPLKDLWRFNIAENDWVLLEGKGDVPGCLQEHSLIAYHEFLYVFGGEVGFSNAGETPLWIYTIPTNAWRKYMAPKNVQTPSGRRGHTATLFQDSMYIYGGYQDLKGSTSELWAFHFGSETWHLVSQGGGPETPLPRHRHSTVLHDSSLWVFGGMTNLEERSDFWKFDFVNRKWKSIRSKPGPGCLNSHTAVKFLSVMMLFGGEREGETLNEIWRFHFATEFWERLTFSQELSPSPRTQPTAFIFSQFLTSRGTVHYMSLPEQKENDESFKSSVKYNFDDKRNDCLSELWQEFKSRPQSFTRFERRPHSNVLKDIVKLSTVNLSKMSHDYSMFTNESSESLQSNPSCLESSASLIKNDTQSSSLVRDNFSVPNFASEELSIDSKLTRFKVANKNQTKRSDSAFTFTSIDSSSTSSGLHFSLLQIKDIKLIDLEEESLSGYESNIDSYSQSNEKNSSCIYKSIAQTLNQSFTDVVCESSRGIELPCLNKGSFEKSQAKNESPTQLVLYMYIIGGKEIGKGAIFKRSLSIWKLDLTQTF